MADVRYQYRGIGLLPPDLAGWLDYYDRNRLPIAMEEWKLKVKQAVEAGQVDPKYMDALIGIVRQGQIDTKDLAKQLGNMQAIDTQSKAGISKAIINADASKYASRAKVAIANAQERGMNWRLRTKFAQDVAASGAITAAEMSSIANIVGMARSAIENNPGDRQAAIRNAVKIASQQALADAAAIAEKNPIHADAYLGAAAKQMLAALHVNPDELPAAKEAVNTFFLKENGVDYKEDENGYPDVFAPYHDDPIYGDAFREASRKPQGAGVSNEAIPDLTSDEYQQAGAIVMSPDAIQAASVAAGREAAASDGQPGVVTDAGRTSAPVESQRGATRLRVPPAMLHTEYTAPGDVGMSGGSYGAAEIGRALDYTQAEVEWAKAEMAKQRAAAEARKTSGEATIPPFRLAPEPGPNPRQAEFDAIKARLDAMRKNNPDAYERFRHLAGEVKRSRIPDSAMKADIKENALDKIVKDEGSPEFSTGPMETTPSEHAADFGRRSSADFARLKAAQLDAGIADTPEGKEERMKFLQDRAAALALMSPAQRKAFGSSFTADEESWNTVNTMVQERVRGAAKAKAAQPPGMFDAPEDTAKLDKALEKAAASGPTPNDVRERTRDFAQRVYDAAVADAADDGDYAGAFRDAIEVATNGAVKDIDIPTFTKDFNDIWAADERPGPFAAHQQNAAKLQQAFNVVPELPVGTPRAVPSMPGEALRAKPQDVPPPLPGQPPPLPATGWTVPAAVPVSNAAVGGVMNPAVGGPASQPPMVSGNVSGMGAQVEAPAVPALAFPETDEENEVYDYLTESWKETNPKAAGESDDAYHARAVGEATKLFQNLKATEASP